MMQIDGQMCGMRKMDVQSSMKLEEAYEKFLNDLKNKGPDHIEVVDLWSDSM